MATIITNPTSVPQGVTTGYQAQNNILFAGNIGVKNICFNSDFTQALAGFVYEVGGNLVKSTAAENVAGISSIPNNSYFYIYGNTSLYASVTEPLWNAGFCGYYNGNDRALIKCAKDSGGIQEVDFNTDFSSNILKPTSLYGGTIVPGLDISGSRLAGAYLTKGWYRALIKAGGGGGGHGYSYIDPDWPNLSRIWAGGNGGYLNIIFYNQYNDCYIGLNSGGGGLKGIQYRDNGGDGEDSRVTINDLNISWIAFGGKGGEKGYNSSGGGANGANGGNNQNSSTGGGAPGGTGGPPSTLRDEGQGTDGSPGSIQIFKY